MKTFLLSVLLLATAAFSFADGLPAKPEHYFNDYAHVVSNDTALHMESTLANLEKTTSTQFVVAIYPKLEVDNLEDFTQKTSQSWHMGQKKTNNGLVLFLFADSTNGHKKIRYEVGYGLEGAFPDAKAALIIQQEIVPALKAGNWDLAVSKGVSSAILQVKGEYTAPATKQISMTSVYWVVGGFMVLFIILCCTIGFSNTLNFCTDILLVFSGTSSGSSSGPSGGGGSFGGGGSSGDA